MDIAFRPARVTDVDIAVDLIHDSGPHELAYGFDMPGQSSRKFVRYCFKDGKGFFGYTIHQVAELDGQVVGIGAFYPGKYYNAYTCQLTWQILKFYSLRNIPRVLFRLWRLTSVMPSISKDVFFLSDFGVRSDMRSKGIGRAMLASQYPVGRALSCRKFSLDVSASNPRAQALYERTGLKVLREQVFRGPRDAVANSFRMEMPL